MKPHLNLLCTKNTIFYLSNSNGNVQLIFILPPTMTPSAEHLISKEEKKNMMEHKVLSCYGLRWKLFTVPIHFFTLQQNYFFFLTVRENERAERKKRYFYLSVGRSVVAISIWPKKKIDNLCFAGESMSMVAAKKSTKWVRERESVLPSGIFFSFFFFAFDKNSLYKLLLI